MSGIRLPRGENERRRVRAILRRIEALEAAVFGGQAEEKSLEEMSKSELAEMAEGMELEFDKRTGEKRLRSMIREASGAGG